MMLQKTRPYLTALLALSVAGSLPSRVNASEEEGWSVDSSHTSINFSIKHFFMPVKGNFSDFEIDLDYDAENPENSSVEARIQVASVDTGNERRDSDLRIIAGLLVEA